MTGISSVHRLRSGKLFQSFHFNKSLLWSFVRSNFLHTSCRLVFLFLKYAWIAHPDMLINEMQKRRCRNNYFMRSIRNWFPLFNLTHVALISTPHKTFVLFTVLCFKWMRFIWFVDVIKYGILLLMVWNHLGVLYTVSLPWCSITLYHTEWVNMILNYSFLCHSHLFSEDLCLPICEVFSCGWKTEPRSICLELGFYVKLWRSTYLLKGLRAGKSKSSLGGH